MNDRPDPWNPGGGGGPVFDDPWSAGHSSPAGDRPREDAPTAWPGPAPYGPPPGGRWQPPPAPAGPPPRSPRGDSPFPTLMVRQLVVPVLAMVIAVVGGVTYGHSDDADLCMALSAAEASWESDDPDSFTDTESIDRLGAVAKRHRDPSVRRAGRELAGLTGVFSYGRYSSIVTPIEFRC